jgi:hypothetical protein
MKKLFSLLALVAFLSVTVKAQSYTKLTQGRAQDTISKSRTAYTASVNLNSSVIQAVVVSAKTTSVSGTPDVKYVVQRSMDNTNWWSVVGDTMTYSATETKYVHINPYYGVFLRVVSYTGSGTQVSKSTITVKSWNAN